MRLNQPAPRCGSFGSLLEIEHELERYLKESCDLLVSDLYNSLKYFAIEIFKQNFYPQL